ncbi:hypothetical protein [Lyngbya confervoides]|uniref:Uncharacterized protein n=1 Tax=Lyngbya confervoides BDU141951 TaxID=1574623 RepID=A0ABD4T444_9CYAN|nr:hypothetical protein [Lyngbya confervoides]MCM1983492.1 hypothetical protein [Lyngbya confervoides BDU141951]
MSDMITIESKLHEPRRFDSFFGPVTLHPGLNFQVSARLWKNLKKVNPDVQSLLDQDLLREVGEDA